MVIIESLKLNRCSSKENPRPERGFFLPVRMSNVRICNEDICKSRERKCLHSCRVYFMIASPQHERTKIMSTNDVVGRLQAKAEELRDTAIEITVNRVQWQRHGDSMMVCYYLAEAIVRRLRAMYGV